MRRSNRLAALLMPELDQAEPEPEPEPEPSPERAWGKPAAAEEQQHAWYHVDHRDSPPPPQPEPEPLWESPEQESPLGGNSPLEAEEEYLRALQQQEMEEVGDEGSALQRAAEAVAGLVRRAVEDPAYYGTGAGEMTVDGVHPIPSLFRCLWVCLRVCRGSQVRFETECETLAEGWLEKKTSSRPHRSTPLLPALDALHALSKVEG